MSHDDIIQLLEWCCAEFQKIHVHMERILANHTGVGEG